jgi:hypothetical protein
MTRWAHVRDGACDTIVNAIDKPPEVFGGRWIEATPEVEPGWRWDGTQWSEPTTAVRSLSPLQFLRRFTATEREALEDITATGTAAQRKKLNAFRFYIQTGGYVELDDDYIIASVTAMETVGVLAAGRAAQILAP